MRVFVYTTGGYLETLALAIFDGGEGISRYGTYHSLLSIRNVSRCPKHATHPWTEIRQTCLYHWSLIRKWCAVTD